MRRKTTPPPVTQERFVEADDGTRLLVRIHSPQEQRSAPLVLLDGLGCEGYVWAHIADYFRAQRPVIYWQYRGHGRSEVPRDLATLTMAQVVADLGRVLDATHTDQAVLCGHSMGVQVALEAYRTMGERIAGLALLCGGYEHPMESWHASPDPDAPPTLANRAMRRVFPYLTGAFLHYPDVAMRVWRRAIPTRLTYELAVRTEVNGARFEPRDFWPYLKHLGEMDMRVFATFARALAAHSAADVLPMIEVPTLIVGAGRDTFTPVWLSEEMWRRIPESDYLHIPDGTHAAPIEHPELVQLRLEKFLRERIDPGRAVPREAPPQRRRAGAGRTKTERVQA